MAQKFAPKVQQKLASSKAFGRFFFANEVKECPKADTSL
jgi:hypothetical protein